MTRRPLSRTSKTVVTKFKLPSDLADAFALRCGSLGYTKSDQLRLLVERWLRQTAHLERVRAKSVTSAYRVLICGSCENRPGGCDDCHPPVWDGPLYAPDTTEEEP